MEIQQRRFSNRVRFEFGDEELRYTLQDGSGSRSFAIAYTAISRDRQTLEEHNHWLANVGLLWLGLGSVLTIANWMKHSATPSIWLLAGAACYAMYWFRRTRFTLLPSEKGNVLVIEDHDGPRVIDEIERRRAAQFRREYDFLNADESPEQQRSRFNWLHTEGALSADELRERLAAIAREPAFEVPQGQLLN